MMRVGFVVSLSLIGSVILTCVTVLQLNGGILWSKTSQNNNDANAADLTFLGPAHDTSTLNQITTRTSNYRTGERKNTSSAEFTSEKSAVEISKSTTSVELDEFTETIARITGPNAYTAACPADGCGCPYRGDTNCPRHYQPSDVVAISQNNLSSEVTMYMDSLLAKKREEAKTSCLSKQRVMFGGGWCLKAKKKQLAYELDGVRVTLTRGHIKSNAGLCGVLHNLVREDSIQSMSDFGAGIGQYGACVRSEFPQLAFNSYDGATNVESHTQGLVNYVDFTLPLHLPVTDWIISFEVGEHIPSAFEGIFIRNLHTHNCRGIVISWATFQQKGGTSHINLHDNAHLKQSFLDLGYYHDDTLQSRFRVAAAGTYFDQSLMVFRRHNPVC